MVDSDDVAISADEASSWPRGALELCLKSGFIVPAQSSQTASCPECPESYVGEVSIVPSPSAKDGQQFYLRCPECGLVPIEPKCLNRWRFDLDALARWVGFEFGCTGPIVLTLPSRVWSYGVVELDGRKWSLFFIRGLGWKDAEAQILGNERIRRAKNALIILSAPATDQILKHLQARTVVSLAETVKTLRGKITIDWAVFAATIGGSLPKPKTKKNKGGRRPKHSEETIRRVFTMLGKGRSHAEIARILKLSKTAVAWIIRKNQGDFPTVSLHPNSHPDQ